MKKAFIITMGLLFLLISSNGLAQMTRRSAKTLPKGKFLFWLTSYYSDYTRKYNSPTGEWSDLTGDNLKVGVQAMFVYGIMDRWEAMINIPLGYAESTSAGITNCSHGLGDITLQTRYCLMKGSKRKPFLTITGAVRFPSGDKGCSPKLGDGTTDYALGFLLLSPRFGKYKGHIKVAYWRNGETNSNVNLGDRLEYLLKLDYHLIKNLMGFFSLKGLYTFENTDSSGNILQHTDKRILYAVPGFVWKPVKWLNIKPKLYIFLSGKGGKRYNLSPMLDTWVVF